MQSFEIKIGSKKLKVRPLETETYESYFGDKLISIISPNVGAKGLEWKSTNLNAVKTKTIGKLI